MAMRAPFQSLVNTLFCTIFLFYAYRGQVPESSTRDVYVLYTHVHYRDLCNTIS
ncbi:hypothetical protein BDZ94DRAFT_1257880 [Collybia nuda]|uniref:Secreted protein n=1 Tax=Collybia nuda TaxID=64659 RepID=A0A9P5Y8Z0_9AGAR|nr:hypothetical protein BDZ94DRAFT_1257880 [Collybia nuda]